MTDAERRAQLLALWIEHPAHEHTSETGILNFYHWVSENRSELLVTGKGDPYQHLCGDLAGHIN